MYQHIFRDDTSIRVANTYIIFLPRYYWEDTYNTSIKQVSDTWLQLRKQTLVKLQYISLREQPKRSC